MSVAAILSDVVVWIPAPILLPARHGLPDTISEFVPSGSLSLSAGGHVAVLTPGGSLSSSSGGSMSRTVPTVTLVGVG